MNVSNPKVLIVDDAGFVRGIIKKYLEQDDFEVVGEADDGDVGLELFKQLQPDIVTMDITMPNMDGLTCMEEMLKIKSDTKILIITSLNNKTTLLEAVDRGAAGFIVKPFVEAKLIAEFKKLLAPL